MQEQPGWEFWVDRGGTFTDVIGRAPDGRLVVRKVPSADPLHTGDAVLRGIQAILGEEPAGMRRIQALKIGTTVATNALLERRGARTALLVTRGFADLLLIGEQHLYALPTYHLIPRKFQGQRVQATLTEKCYSPFRPSTVGRVLSKRPFAPATDAT